MVRLYLVFTCKIVSMLNFMSQLGCKGRNKPVRGCWYKGQVTARRIDKRDCSVPGSTWFLPAVEKLLSITGCNRNISPISHYSYSCDCHAQNGDVDNKLPCPACLPVTNCFVDNKFPCPACLPVTNCYLGHYMQGPKTMTSPAEQAPRIEP